MFTDLKSHSILVTGGAGYIGSHVVKALLTNGLHTVVLDNLSTGSKNLILGDIFIEGNICDHKLITEVLQKYCIQTVIHLAASTSVPESIMHPIHYYENNTLGTLTLIKCCVRQNVRYFIFSSTAAVYGAPKQPIVSEKSTISPINPYGKSKYMCEQIIEDVVKTSSLKAVFLRYFNVAGCDPDGQLGQISPEATHLIKTAVKTVCGAQKSMPLYGTDYDTPDGTCIRDYIHVTDLADIHLRTLYYLLTQNKSEIINCGYGHGFSVKEVLDAIQKITHTSIQIIPQPRRPGDCPMLIADNSKLQQLFKWKPKYDDLTTILNSVLTWEKQHT